MELSAETETLFYNITTSQSADNPQTTTLTISSHDKPYFSENDSDWEHDQEHIQSLISNCTTPNPNKKHLRTHHMTRAKSDLTNLLHTSHKKSHQKQIESLTKDDLKIAYLNQRKQRQKAKKQYQRKSRQYQKAITKTADDYEDQLKQHESDLKQEYEAKLISAEIQRNESEQKIAALNAELNRLKTLLHTTNPNSNNSYAQSVTSMHSVLSMEAETGPLRVNAMSPSRHNFTINAHNNATTPIATMQGSVYNFGSPSVNEGNTGTQSVSGTTVSSVGSDENNMSQLRVRSHSMQQKLRIAMSPSLKYPHEIVGSYGIGTEVVSDAGMDTEDNIVVFDGYDAYKNNANVLNESDSCDTTESERERIQRKKRRKAKRKRKKKKPKRKEEETKSFWDFLVKCITPNVGDICDTKKI